jgi:hypothetical protein
METYIITSGTSSHDRLRKQFFEPSLKQCEPVEWVHFQKQSLDPGNFMQGEWLSSINWAARNALKATRIAPESALIVLSDLDIVWLPGAFTELSRVAENGVWAMCENDRSEINTGLLVSKNTREFRWLLMHVLEEMKLSPGRHDQDALRKIAGRTVNVLPVEFANTKTVNLIEPAKALCFHAICTMSDENETSIEKKARLLSPWLDRCQSPMAT